MTTNYTPPLDDFEDESSSDADDFFGAPIPSVTWPEVGATVTGTVLGVEMSDQTDINTGEVKRFSNGQIRRQAIITLQTTEQDDDDDDGRRRLFVKGAMVKSFRDEMKRHGVRGRPAPGSKLTVTYVEDGEPTAKGMNPPKLFAVDYQPPDEEPF